MEYLKPQGVHTSAYTVLCTSLLKCIMYLGSSCLFNQIQIISRAVHRSSYPNRGVIKGQPVDVQIPLACPRRSLWSVSRARWPGCTGCHGERCSGCTWEHRGFWKHTRATDSASFISCQTEDSKSVKGVDLDLDFQKNMRLIQKIWATVNRAVTWKLCSRALPDNPWSCASPALPLTWLSPGTAGIVSAPRWLEPAAFYHHRWAPSRGLDPQRTCTQTSQPWRDAEREPKTSSWWRFKSQTSRTVSANHSSQVIMYLETSSQDIQLCLQTMTSDTNLPM